MTDRIIVGYLEERSLGFENLDDGDHREWQNRAKSEHPANSNGPRWVRIVTIGHRGVLDQRQQQYELQQHTTAAM